MERERSLLKRSLLNAATTRRRRLARVRVCARVVVGARGVDARRLGEMQFARVKPDLFSYNAAMTACAKGAEWERALALLGELRPRGLEPSVVSYNAVVFAFVKSAQWRRAIQVRDPRGERSARSVEGDLRSGASELRSAGAPARRTPPRRPRGGARRRARGGRSSAGVAVGVWAAARVEDARWRPLFARGSSRLM